MSLLLLLRPSSAGASETNINTAIAVDFDFIVHNLKNTEAAFTMAVIPSLEPYGITMTFPLQVTYALDDAYMRKCRAIETTFEIVPTFGDFILGEGWDNAFIRINNGADVSYSRNLQVMLNIYSIVGGDYVYPDRFRWREDLTGTWSEWFSYTGTHDHPLYFNVTATHDDFVTIYVETGTDPVDGEDTPVTETDEGLASDTIYLMTGTIIVQDDILVVTAELPPEPPLPGVRRPRRLPIASVRRADIRPRRRPL